MMYYRRCKKVMQVLQVLQVIQFLRLHDRKTARLQDDVLCITSDVEEVIGCGG